MKLARVFAEKNKYTPDDESAFTSGPDLFTPRYDEVHVSCCYTWNKPKAERLALEWEGVCDKVRLGGPAYDDPGGEFTPGRYVRKGYVQTSRGCVRKCPFCFVHGREGGIRELKIHNGAWVMDNNLLACSRKHIEGVFGMLADKKGIKFLGGLDTHLLKDWHIDALASLKKQIQFLYIAYDMETDRDSVAVALERFHNAGLKQAQLWCFVLVGFGDDTQEDADRRCEWVVTQGGIPFASFYRAPDETESRKPPEWAALTSRWTYLPVILSRVKREGLHHHARFERGMFC